MLKFRLAKDADAPEIAELSRELIENGLSWTWHPRRVLKSIRARDTNVLVATERECLVGFAIMDFGYTHAHLSLLAVRTLYQRRGIGKKLLTWLEEAALVAGIKTVELELRESNHAARRFYQKLGFTEIAHVRGYYHGIETAIRMARDIRRVV